MMSNRDEETGENEWAFIPGETTFSLPVDESRILNLGVRRAELFASNAEQVLEISNGLGSRRLVEVSAAVHQPPSQAGASGSMQADNSVLASDPRFAGLWLGVASIDKVSMAQQGGVNPVTTGGGESPLRLIVHVDAGGRTVLLDEVVQRWPEGSWKPSPDDPDYNGGEKPGHYVLVSEATRLHGWEADGRRGG